jgi:hypothetical protein
MGHSIKIIGLQAGKRLGRIKGRGRLATTKRCFLIRALLRILGHKLVNMPQLRRNLDIMYLQGPIKQIKTNLLKLYLKIFVELHSQCLEL